jgi:hypothetical protein
MLSHSCPPRFAVQRAPTDPAFATLRPAHDAPRPMPRMTGIIGRSPDGPRRSMNVTPAPIVIPIRAAVSRSYSLSRPSRPALARTETRGCWERRGRFGAMVGAITFLLEYDIIGRVGQIE